MSGPDLDLEKTNLIGGLDRLVTNFAISAVAVIPTFLACIVTPWRLAVLLDRDDPDGRMGMLLAPGAYFPLSLMVSFIAAALFATPETLSSNNSFIGPGLAVSVQTAASNGDIWKIAATIMPLYGVAVLIGLLGTILKPWAQRDWTLRISLRAAFYVTATLTCWVILTTTVIDFLRVSAGRNDIMSFLYPTLMILTGGAVVWMYFWFFHKKETVSWFKAGVLSVAMFGLILSVFFLADFLIRL